MNLNTAYFILIIILAGTSFLSTSCTDLSDRQTMRIQEALGDTLVSSTESWNVDMKIIEEGQRKVRLTGSYAASYNLKEMKETRISGPVHIQVYDTLDVVETWVDCNRAIYRAEDAEFELFGDVKVRTRTNRRLESEYLRWNQSNNLITTPRFVIITTPSDSIAGTGFEGTTDLSSYTIEKPTGRVTVN